MSVNVVKKVKKIMLVQYIYMMSFENHRAEGSIISHANTVQSNSNDWKNIAWKIIIL